MSTKMKIECYDYDSDTKKKFIGSCEFQVASLIDDMEFSLEDHSKIIHGYPKVTGYIVVKKFNLIEENSFIDYLRQGMNINLTIAIDYTTSNGEVENINSLHYVKNDGLNEYETVMDIIGTILSEYDNDKRYPLFGFGGQPNWFSKASHCFPLNRDPENPFLEGYDEVKRVYRSTLCEIDLSGPTFLHELILKQIELSDKAGDGVYQILLILTDGDLHDYQETVDAIVEASYRPISILIIGIGFENFLLLKKLDGDKKLLENSRGKKCTRDIVQFVPFRKFADNLAGFAKEALMEIPTQLMKYMTSVKGLQRTQKK